MVSSIGNGVQGLRRWVWSALSARDEGVAPFPLNDGQGSILQASRPDRPGGVAVAMRTGGPRVLWSGEDCVRLFGNGLFAQGVERRSQGEHDRRLSRVWVFAPSPGGPVSVLVAMTPRGPQTSHGDGTDASLSPSLRGKGNGLGPAYEIKFLLDEARAAEVEARLLTLLLPDPHCDPTLGGMYAITNMTCDAPGLPVFYRDEKVKNRKYRVRRYGTGDVVYLERKRSRKGRVTKRRVEAAVGQLESVAAGRSDEAAHSWFLQEVREMDLAPVCRMRYLRRALFGTAPDGAVRVTFDRSIRGSLAAGWSMDARGEERTLLDGLVICEFKFHNAMPAALKAIAAAMRLEPTGVSKYRTCVRAFARELGVDAAPLPPVRAGVGVPRA